MKRVKRSNPPKCVPSAAPSSLVQVQGGATMIEYALLTQVQGGATAIEYGLIAAGGPVDSSKAPSAASVGRLSSG